jgi:hypothetical protein
MLANRIVGGWALTAPVRVLVFLRPQRPLMNDGRRDSVVLPQESLLKTYILQRLDITSGHKF